MGENEMMNRRALLAAGFSLPPLLMAVPSPAQEAAEGPAAYLRRFENYMEQAGQSADYLPDVEKFILSATNNRRQEAGAAPLAEDQRLTWIARFYAGIMAKAGRRIDHVDAQGRTPDQRIAVLHRRHVGPTGENLFQTNLFNRSEPRRGGELTVDSLMESPLHRENLLKPDWTHAGMGAVTDGELLFVVQLFALRQLLLADDLPISLPAGRKLPDAATRFEVGSADQVMLVPAGKEPSGSSLMRLENAATPSADGAFRLWYAVQRGDTVVGDGQRRTRYDLNPGPIVSVGD